MTTPYTDGVEKKSKSALLYFTSQQPSMLPFNKIVERIIASFPNTPAFHVVMEAGNAPFIAHKISAVPTLVYYKDGVAADSTTGLKPAAAVRAFLEDVYCE